MSRAKCFLRRSGYTILSLAWTLGCHDSKKKDFTPEEIKQLSVLSPTGHGTLGGHRTVGGDLGPKSKKRKPRPTPSQDLMDVKAYDITLKVDPAKKAISGHVIVSLHALNDLGQLELDFSNQLSTTKVERLDDDDQPEALTFDHNLNVLTLHTAVERDDNVRVRVTYEGVPQETQNPPWQNGFHWMKSFNDKPWIGVNTEGEGPALWMPCKDDPSDEPERVRQTIRVPSGLIVAANGVLLEQLMGVENGYDEYVWETKYPINHYNITFHVGDFIKHEVGSKSSAKYPIVFFALEGDGPHQSYYGYDEPVDYRLYSQRISDFMAMAQDYAQFLESKFGAFPFRNEKMGFAHSYAVGMEQQTIISYGSNFYVIHGFDPTLLHELAHEWWGNQITAKTWSDLWIHEGFATYAEALFAEAKFGKDAYRTYMREVLGRRIADHMPVVVKNARQNQVAEQPNIYNKGAWVLHMLRVLMGDESFMKLLHDFATRRPSALDNLVTTEDFLKLSQTYTKTPLSGFFKLYLYEGDIPALKQERSAAGVALTWSSTLFQPPIEFVIEGPSGERKDVLRFVDGRAQLALGPDEKLIVDPENQWLFK